MAKPQVSLPQGTRDFGPDVVRKRQFIFTTLRTVFELYGFQPLETPAMENLDTLMGKYGDEGDKLIFKILNNGLNDPKNTEKASAAFQQVLAGKNDKNLTERALRYDLTIPFARYVAMNQGQLVFPFKRYQVQPVWRADRPQKGRYREFYQCDADVVGSTSLLNELELAGIYHEALSRLGLKGYTIKINSRKILAALAEVCGGQDKMTDITIAIDKLDKIGLEKVKEELADRNLPGEAIALIERYLNIKGNVQEVLSGLDTLVGYTESGKKGLQELRYIFDNLTDPSIPIEPDPTLARGLNYYTGIIFEVKAPDTVKIGSIGGGGRYDDLTGTFGVPGIPGVGISFGVDRIYDVMEELNLFPPEVAGGTRVLFVNMGEAEAKAALGLAMELRKKGISAEIYPETAKLDKQFKYADKKNISFVAIIGEQELTNRQCQLKDLATGEQRSVPFSDLPDYKF
ncbi:MAG: histidine--tRNA ligase [Chitinophagaceae bacterium]|nr:histidine--tRNA ligase [Chitinophagaceae bacterium]